MTVDVTGVWVGSIGSGGNLHADARLELEQKGSKVAGTLRVVGAERGLLSTVRSGPVEGNVAGDVFRFARTDGFVKTEMLVNLDEMTGYADVGTRVPVSFHRVSASPRPASQP